MSGTDMLHEGTPHWVVHEYYLGEIPKTAVPQCMNRAPTSMPRFLAPASLGVPNTLLTFFIGLVQPRGRVIIRPYMHRETMSANVTIALLGDISHLLIPLLLPPKLSCQKGLVISLRAGSMLVSSTRPLARLFFFLSPDYA